MSGVPEWSAFCSVGHHKLALNVSDGMIDASLSRNIKRLEISVEMYS